MNKFSSIQHSYINGLLLLIILALLIYFGITNKEYFIGPYNVGKDNCIDYMNITNSQDTKMQMLTNILLEEFKAKFSYLTNQNMALKDTVSRIQDNVTQLSSYNSQPERIQYIEMKSKFSDFINKNKVFKDKLSMVKDNVTQLSSYHQLPKIYVIEMKSKFSDLINKNKVLMDTINNLNDNVNQLSNYH